MGAELDFLMDENIITNESREEDEIRRMIRTPHTIQTNQQSFNQQTHFGQAKK
jgi:hypothetical protein